MRILSSGHPFYMEKKGGTLIDSSFQEINKIQIIGIKKRGFKAFLILLSKHCNYDRREDGRWGEIKRRNFYTSLFLREVMEP